MSKKMAYLFGGKMTEGNKDMKEILGGKGANLAEMSNTGVPVPPGFTIPTDICVYFMENNGQYPDGIQDQVKSAIESVEKEMGGKFGDRENMPVLFSVRSGARASMPGMMDTVLNIGINEEVVKVLAEKSGNERFAWDSYRRFIQMYSEVVMGMDSEVLEEMLTEMKSKKGVKNDTELSADDLKDLVAGFKSAVERDLKQQFPTDPMQQIWGAIGAVFKSWNTERAKEYRRLNAIPDNWGTAVNCQAMVFGNMGDDCATGVAFTRDPSTGENRFFGEYLVNAQGEDVVAGIRTPLPINIAAKTSDDHQSLEEVMPVVYKELEAIYLGLEKHFTDMQDIEFTVQSGKLWMLQTRAGKRTAPAAVRIAVEMEKEGLIDKKEAVLRVEPDQIDQLLHPMIDPDAERKLIAKGLPASPGAAYGQVVFDSPEVEKWVADGKKVILVRLETSPEDIKGMNLAQGILTERGGMTSHAAVVARGMGKCCIAGCSEISVDSKAKLFKVGDREIKEGEWITLDGSKGEVLDGQVPTVKAELSGDFGILMSWADEFRRLGVRTNADTPNDAKTAREYGAEGIGLCRTEHMFFEGNRIDAVREMILSDTLEGREKALKKLLPMQRSDFEGIFEAMQGLPVTIRLLDPPLHEFIPHTAAEIEDLSKKMDVPVAKLKARVDDLQESNPMLGHRGCRLAVSYPEVCKMQTRAIMEAACHLKKEKGLDVRPEIMVPLIAHVNELKYIEAFVREECAAVIKEFGSDITYMVGTMIEIPRAALTADEVADVAEFFSFGTNDLTQMTMGLSRDDSGKFLAEYVEKKILPADPFQKLDQTGVGMLVDIAVKKGREKNPKLKLGICGEHGGEPSSIDFCHRVGLDYVSCSPFRVPIARLAAAHAALKNG